MDRDSFVMYRSFWEAIRELKNDEIAESIKAIANYALYGTVPDVSGVAKSIFIMAKPQIDANNKRYENGNKGGRKPNQNQTETKPEPKANQSVTKPEPNENVNENDNVNDLKDNVSLPQVESHPSYPYEDIVDYLNQKAGTHYRYSSADTRKHIKARFNDGYSLDDFKTVIDKKVSEWKGTDMEKYIRPATLFGSKFESYLNQIEPQKSKRKGSFNQFEQNNYDFDQLEKELLSN